MAVAALTGHGDADLLELLPSTVSPDRVALVGLREWTDDDIGNVADWGIHTFVPDDLRSSTQPLLAWLTATGAHGLRSTSTSIPSTATRSSSDSAPSGTA